MPRFVLYGLMLIGVGSVFFFSWIPQPRLELTTLLPDWLSRWTDNDANMNLRTAIPFVFLGLVAGSWLANTRQPVRLWVLAWLALVLVVGVAEAGQLFRPLRHFDWGDIGWGSAGAAIGLVLAGGINRLVYSNR